MRWRRSAVAARRPVSWCRIRASRCNSLLQRERKVLALGAASPSACAADKGDFAISKLADVRLYSSNRLADPTRTVVCAYPDELDQIPEAQFLKSRGLQRSGRCITDNIGVIRH